MDILKIRRITAGTVLILDNTYSKMLGFDHDRGSIRTANRLQMMTFVVYYGVTVCDCVHLWYLLADEYFKPAIKMSGACKPKLV
jgi:hypothetical protein